jgi:hypothetical protein
MTHSLEDDLASRSRLLHPVLLLAVVGRGDEAKIRRSVVVLVPINVVYH